MSISSLADFFYRAPHTKTDCKDKLFFILKWNSISLQQKFCDDLFFQVSICLMLVSSFVNSNGIDQVRLGRKDFK